MSTLPCENNGRSCGVYSKGANFMEKVCHIFHNNFYILCIVLLRNPQKKFKELLIHGNDRLGIVQFGANDDHTVIHNLIFIVQ